MTHIPFNITSKLFYRYANNMYKSKQLFMYTIGYVLLIYSVYTLLVLIVFCCN